MPKNYTLDDILNEYSGEEKHKSAVKNKTAVKTEIKSNGQTGKIEDTGYIKIPSGGIPDETITYSVKELEQINAPAKRPSPSHRSGKFQVADIGRPNVSYINSVKEVKKNPADLPPRPTDEIKYYDGAVVTQNASDEEYAPKVRKMSDSTRAKEMRVKRRKKKQPEFTYEKESPDGIYTKPQKKKAKFVVAPEDTERKNSPEKKKAVNLSADSDPEALDVEIDVSNLRTVNTDERKNETKTDNGAIKDYDSFEDAGEIRRSITDLKVSLSFRLAVLAVLLVFVTFISVGELISLPVPELLTRKNPAVFSCVQLIIALLSMMVSMDTVKSGLLNLIKFKADTDSLAAFSSLSCAAASLACVINPKLIFDGAVYIYTPIAVMLMFFNAMGKRLILQEPSLILIL